MTSKRILPICMTCIIIILSFTIVFASANTSQKENVKNDAYRITEITKASDLPQLDDTDVATVDGKVIIRFDSKDIKHIIDNSSLTVIENISQSELSMLANRIGAELQPAELAQGQQTIGAIISKDNLGDAKITEVIAEVADKLINEEIIRTDKDKADEFLMWLSDNAKLDIDGIYNDFVAESIEYGSKASTTSFGDMSKYRYLYSAPNEVNYTEYESTADSSRYLLATTKVVIYGYKAKTSGNTTYDSFKAYINVTPHNNLRVKKFNGNLYTPENSRYNVLGATELESDSSASTSRSISVTLPSDVCSISGALTHTYSYITGGKDITNRVLFTEYKSQWIVKPISPGKNASYSIKPGMVVKAQNGTANTNTAKASLSYLELKDFLTAGWVSDKNVVVTLQYKNHAQIN